MSAAIVTAPAPAAMLLSVGRVRAKAPTVAPIAVRYRDDGKGLPTLTILSHWQTRKQEYRDQDRYVVEEIPVAGGRGFLLHRDPDTVAAEGTDADAYYGVLVAHNDQDHQCECKGYQAHGRCKHFDALRNLIDAGHIDHPLCDPRPDPVVDMIEAPF